MISCFSVNTTTRFTVVVVVVVVKHILFCFFNRAYEENPLKKIR